MEDRLRLNTVVRCPGNESRRWTIKKVSVEECLDWYVDNNFDVPGGNPRQSIPPHDPFKTGSRCRACPTGKTRRAAFAAER